VSRTIPFLGPTVGSQFSVNSRRDTRGDRTRRISDAGLARRHRSRQSLARSAPRAGAAAFTNLGVVMGSDIALLRSVRLRANDALTKRAPAVFEVRGDQCYPRFVLQLRKTLVHMSRRKNRSKLTHHGLVAAWRKTAKAHFSRNNNFLTSLIERIDQGLSDRVDKSAKEIHNEVFSEVDCKKCANCCRLSPNVEMKDADIQRISTHLGISTEEFRRRYDVATDQDGDQVMKAGPCPFLKNDLCTIYEIRPNACREYPTTDQPFFLMDPDLHTSNCGVHRHIRHSQVCPAVFHIIEALRREYT
jgi:uncharacterized protein